MKQDFKVGERVVVSSDHTNYSKIIMTIDEINEEGLLGFDDFINRDIWFYPEEAYHDHRELYEKDSSYHYYFYPYTHFHNNKCYVLEAIYDYANLNDESDDAIEYIKNGIDSLKAELREEYRRMAISLAHMSDRGTPHFVNPEHRMEYVTRIVSEVYYDILETVSSVLNEFGLEAPHIDLEEVAYNLIKLSEIKARRGE
ncbi:hypothetical protein CF038_22675 [Klebsiella michiganensis]|uniref:hypothetical protein n=1 Tax=Klebsiella michiganensis TaxID=1134687 RepID=UPI001CA538BF|nr:hypothetical protein [Klebsiella michiganensis]MBW5995412.1 hypothetical protein [Klebsiella michiganensis]MBX8651876.1 hypothetical protein [Klebsiella michiganensis]